MNKLTGYIFFCCGLFLLNCHKDDFRERPFPRLLTNNVIDVSTSGATVTATILNNPGMEIKEYGFVYAPVKTALALASKTIATDIKNNLFSAQVKYGFIKDTRYYVRAYLISNSETVYGNALEFLSK